MHFLRLLLVMFTLACMLAKKKYVQLKRAKAKVTKTSKPTTSTLLAPAPHSLSSAAPTLKKTTGSILPNQIVTRSSRTITKPSDVRGTNMKSKSKPVNKHSHHEAKKVSTKRGHVMQPPASVPTFNAIRSNTDANQVLKSTAPTMQPTFKPTTYKCAFTWNEILRTNESHEHPMVFADDQKEILSIRQPEFDHIYWHSQE